MHRIKITLPATITNLGPGLHSLGLAVGLYTTIEISERTDESLVVETEGEGAGRYGVGLRHPVVLGLIRIFQKLERAPLGITIRVSNHIPLDSGLGAEAAFWVAGVIGANNLLGTPYARGQVLEMAAQISKRPDSAVTAILGGLTASLIEAEALVYKALPAKSFPLVVVLPELEHYAEEIGRVNTERVPLSDALHNLSRVPLLVDALREGDLKLIARVIEDKLHLPYRKSHISGYDHVIEMGRRAGAQAITLSGDGPALLAFAEKDHKKIALAMETAFANAGVKARSWVLPVDTQGVVISVAQSA